MAPLFLTQAEVEHLTNRIKPRAQRCALDRMGIHYLTRPDGRPIIPRATIERPSEPDHLRVQPNWSAL